MARIRSIHPGLFTDEAWASCSPLARLLVIGIWTECDDHGVFEWKPVQLKMRLFPVDSADVASLLSEVEAAGVIRAFLAGGKRYGAVRNFCRFQRPRKPKSWFPLPAEVRTFVALGAACDVDEEPEDGRVTKKSEPDPTEPATVTPASEIAPQMEDGGGRVKEEAKASLSSGDDEAAGSGRKKRSYPEAFDAAWKAFPHHEGRSSKPDALAEWKKLPDEERAGLVAAIERFKPKVGETCGGKGAPCMGRWLKHGKHLNWLPAGEVVKAAVPAWPGPSDLFAEVSRHKGADWAAGYLGACRWVDVPERGVVPRNPFVGDRLRQEIGHILDRFDVRVLAEEAA